MKKNNFIILTIITAVVIIFAFSSPMVRAQTPDESDSLNAMESSSAGASTGGESSSAGKSNLPTLDNPLKANTVNEVLNLVVDIAMYVGLAIGTLMLIYAGFKFVTAQGSEDKIKEAKNLFFAVIIGIAVLIAARLIVDVIRSTLTSAGLVKPGIFGGQ